MSAEQKSIRKSVKVTVKIKNTTYSHSHDIEFPDIEMEECYVILSKGDDSDASIEFINPPEAYGMSFRFAERSGLGPQEND